MPSYLAKRLIGIIPVLLLVSVMVFALTQVAPGDPVSMLISDEASPADRQRVIEAWGLDQPAPVQYINFLKNAVMGDFGTSFRYSEPVLDLVMERLPASMELAFYSTILAIAIGIPLGVISAARPNSLLDNAGSIVGFFGVSMPNFWLGILLILVFAGTFNILPSGGREPWGLDLPTITGFLTLDALLQGRLDALGIALRHLALPAIVLGTSMTGIIMQLTRAAVRESLGEDYVMTARAKGLTERVVLWRHSFRNALVAVVTIIGLEFGALISGAIIVETVFAWPGTGLLLIQSITFRDYPLIVGLVLTYTTIFVLVNVLIDLIYTMIDPRIRMS